MLYVATASTDDAEAARDAIASVATGVHGDHVALGSFTLRQYQPVDSIAAAADDCPLISVQAIMHTGQDGCVVVHTDEPHARHQALRLPGHSTVYVGALQELDIEGVIRRVTD